MPLVKWLAAWILLLIILYGFSQTKAGHTVVYYVLWLAVAFLLASHAQEIAAILAQGGIGNGLGNPGGGAG